MKTINLLVLFILNACISFGQTSDCVNAMEIIDKSTLSIFINSDSDEIADDLLIDDCPEVDFEFINENDIPSFWMTWTVFESGTLTFDITMDDIETYDFDFVVYKIDNGELPCDARTPVRCMFAGAVVIMDGTILDTPCNQSTGLSLDDTDLSEPPGCGFGQNNYARYLDVEAGETYIVVVLNFSGIENQFVNIDFCGTALLGPDDVICEPPLNTENESYNQVMLAPNPVGELLVLKNIHNGDKEYSGWRICDMFGATHPVNFIGANESYINVNYLNSGMYFLLFEEDGMQRSIRFIKN